MKPTEELIDAIFIEKVREARKLPIGLKATMGIQIFEEMSGITKSMIRHQNPGVDDTEVERIFRERLEKVEKIENFGIYVPEDSPRR